jgi:hypothetical protein
VTAGRDNLATLAAFSKWPVKTWSQLSKRRLSHRKELEAGHGDGAGSSMTFYTLSIFRRSRGQKIYLRLHSGKTGPVQSCVNVIMKVSSQIIKSQIAAL